MWHHDLLELHFAADGLQFAGDVIDRYLRLPAVVASATEAVTLQTRSVLQVARRCYLSFLNSISSPKSSGLLAFFVRSSTTVAESLVSFRTTLSLRLRNFRVLPSSDNFQTT